MPTGNTRIRTEPLRQRHAPALRQHLRDPQLAASVGIDRVQSLDAARNWIRQRDSATETCQAVMHPDHGLIGLTGLEVFPKGSFLLKVKDCAIFFFWIGPGFRNCGFGTEAMALLQAEARRRRLRYLFSLVQSDNRQSQHVLTKLGFHRAPFEAEPGCDLFHWPASADPPLAPDRARFLYRLLLASLDRPA